MKKALALSLKVAIIGLLLWYVVHTLNQQDFQKEKLQTLWSGWPWLLLAQFFIFLLLLLTFVRWRLLLAAQEIHYSLREAVTLGFIGFFFNQFIPGSTGGDIFKAYYVAMDHPEKKAAGVTTVFLDRVIGLLDLVALAGAALLLNWTRITGDPVLRYLAVLVGVILAGSAVGCILFFSVTVRTHPMVVRLFRRLPFQDILGKIQAAVYVYKYHPGRVAIAVVLSLTVQIGYVGMTICYAMALGAKANFLDFFFIVPLSSLAMSIPTGSPGGLGQSEFAYSELFKRVHFQDGLILALVQRVNWYLISLIGAVCYLRRRDRVNRARRLGLEAEARQAPLGPGVPSNP